tara:strand:- start:59 stop:163 length:105 start_codon:yes stop_codon:yes gene_type:complete
MEHERKKSIRESKKAGSPGRPRGLSDADFQEIER